MTNPSGEWDRYYKNHKRPWSGAVHDCLILPGGSKVLEAGCGNGKYLMGLLENDPDITTFDFSKNAARICRESLSDPAKTLNVRIMTADCRHLPFKNSIFDAAVYRHVIGHMKTDDRRKSAEECQRVLKEKSRLHFTGFSVDDMRAGKGAEKEKNSYLKGNGIMTHYFTEDEVEELFYGFRKVSLKTVKWNLRIRGTDHIRAEITAVFQKITHETKFQAVM